ncbi:MAG: hypothetical protein F9B45_11810 [Phycisphaera sp. RhM]|nr:hypothetical protein [Phycisphaera sp. RhM]
MFVFHRLRSNAARRLISCTLMGVLLCGLIGVPISAPPSEKTGRFPCESCSCGCVTAEFCWDKCCCHSDEEKLQWAYDHHVRPPAFLVARVNRPSAKTAAVEATRDRPKSTSCCCFTQSTAQCATDQCATDLGESYRIDDVGTDQPSPALPIARILRFEDAAKCHGIDLVWTLLSSVVVESQTPAILIPLPPLLYCLILGNDRAIEQALHPDPPVP